MPTSSEKRPCQGTLYARFKHKHPTQNVVTWYSEPGVPGPPEKRTLRRDRKHCPFCSMDLVAGTSFLCFWCNAHKLVERPRAASTNVAPRRLCLHPSSYKARNATPRPERQNLRTELNAAAVWQGQEPLTKRPLQQVSPMEAPKREGVQLHCGKMGVAPYL